MLMTTCQAWWVQPTHCKDHYFQGLGVEAALSLPLGLTVLAVARLELVEVDRWEDAREEPEAASCVRVKCGKSVQHKG